MFKVTGNKGFHLTFDNGYNISIQWGAMNYADHYNGYEKSSNTAEVAIWYEHGPFLPHSGSDGEIVSGYRLAEEVAALIYSTSRRKKKGTLL